MNETEGLSTIAQVSMALTGFAGLLTVFRQRKGGWQPIEMFAVRDLLVASISSCLFALLPIPLLVGGIASETVWAICLPILGVSLLLIIIWAQRERFRARLRPRRPMIYWPLAVIGFGLGLLLVALAFGNASDAEAGLYIAGLDWLLLIATVQFLLQIMESLSGTGKADREPASPARKSKRSASRPG